MSLAHRRCSLFPYKHVRFVTLHKFSSLAVANVPMILTLTLTLGSGGQEMTYVHDLAGYMSFLDRQFLDCQFPNPNPNPRIWRSRSPETDGPGTDMTPNSPKLDMQDPSNTSRSKPRWEKIMVNALPIDTVM